MSSTARSGRGWAFSARSAVLPVTLVLLLVLPLVLAVRAEGYIYWAGYKNDAAGRIGRSALNGSAINPSFIVPQPGTTNSVFDVAVNDTHVYWTRQTVDVGRTIGRAKLDGTGIDNNLLGDYNFEYFYPEDLAVDDSHVYWAYDRSPLNESVIGRAKLDGSGIEPDFIVTSGSVDYVVVSDDHVYWSSRFPSGIGPAFESIGRANLNGTGVQPTWITRTTTPVVIPQPAVGGSHLFWHNFDGTVGRANLNGTGVEQDFIAGLAGSNVGLAVDDGHIYWLDSDSGTIGRANLDGTGVDQAFSTIGSGWSSTDLAVDGLSPQVAGKVKANPNQIVKVVLVKLKVAATERLTAKASGAIKFNPTFELKPRTVEVAAGQSKTLKLKPKKKSQARKIADALDQGRKVTAELEVELTGLAGNRTTEKLSVRLKRG